MSVFDRRVASTGAVLREHGADEPVFARNIGASVPAHGSLHLRVRRGPTIAAIPMTCRRFTFFGKCGVPNIARVRLLLSAAGHGRHCFDTPSTRRAAHAAGLVRLGLRASRRVQSASPGSRGDPRVGCGAEGPAPAWPSTGCPEPLLRIVPSTRKIGQETATPTRTRPPRRHARAARRRSGAFIERTRRCGSLATPSISGALPGGVVPPAAHQEHEQHRGDDCVRTCRPDTGSSSPRSERCDGPCRRKSTMQPDRARAARCTRRWPRLRSHRCRGAAARRRRDDPRSTPNCPEWIHKARLALADLPPNDPEGEALCRCECEGTMRSANVVVRAP
jgi:hypothetical protein